MLATTIHRDRGLFRADPPRPVAPTVTATLANGRARLSAGPFNWDADLPAALGGENLAPSPTAYLLGALAGCAVAFLRDTLAPQFGVAIDDVTAVAGARSDLRGLLAIEGAAPDLGRPDPRGPGLDRIPSGPGGRRCSPPGGPAARSISPCWTERDRPEDEGRLGASAGPARWARYSSRSSLVTTPAGRSPRTATTAGAPPLRRPKASSSEADTSTSGSGPSTTSPTVRSTIDGSRNARSSRLFSLYRADQADHVVAVGLLRDRQLRDPVLLEPLDGVADPLRRPGDDDRRPVDRVVRGRARRSLIRAIAPVVASRPLTRIHSSL